VAKIANAAEARAHLSELVECAAGSPASLGGGRLFRSWMRGPALTSALAVAVACAPAAPQRFPAKPPGCALETVKALPQRPFIELETFGLPSPESIRDVLDLVQDRACRDGADAIYAPKSGRGYSYAIALKWNDAPAPAPPPPPAAPPSP
jgi:hypothetical protein